MNKLKNNLIPVYIIFNIVTCDRIDKNTRCKQGPRDKLQRKVSILAGAPTFNHLPFTGFGE